MATGKSFAKIGPGQRSAGAPEVEVLKEASAQTYTQGAPLVITSGYVAEAGTNPAEVRGFATKAGANGASDGAANASLYRNVAGVKFTGTLSATLTQAMVGSLANLVKTSSSWHLATTTSISSVAQCKIVGPALGFAIGDTNPEVIFTLIGTAVEDDD